jgi:hypothetical protein
MDSLSQYDVWTTLQPFAIVFHQMMKEIHDYCRPLTVTSHLIDDLKGQSNQGACH